MPGLNKQGPAGTGPMTGRQRGLCLRTEKQPFVSGESILGRGMGRCRGLGLGQGQGSGRGLGMGRRFAGAKDLEPAPETGNPEELQRLKEEHQAARKMLSTIEKRIANLEGENPKP